MKMILRGDFSEQDFVILSMFLKKLWKERADVLYVWVEEGFNDKSAEEVMKVFCEIFKNDKEWHMMKVTPELAKDFFDKVLKK
jgi:hypothetical protein